MASKSGGHDARKQGRRGHKVLNGRALGASHTKLTEKFAEIEKEAGHSKDGAGRSEKFSRPKSLEKLSDHNRLEKAKRGR